MIMNQGKINPDLVKERKKCNFKIIELTHLLDGGSKKTEERRAREKFFLEDPELKSKIPLEYLSHKEKYEEAVRKACLVFKKVQQLQNEGKGGMDNFREILGGQIGSAILGDGNPLTLHYVMFIPTIMGQGTFEQQAEWIQKAWECSIIGTYAQTELGHGTFIRGLETTATYDPKSEEFILNSPTLTSFKWWPGGLGHSANYAVVVAQLYTKGKCQGIHPFIVQLRDKDTHMPLPGIQIGEIGCKLGMNSTNNGFLGFKNVRIPRNSMLMKNNQVLPDGTYVSSPSSKLTYGTMIFVRVVLVQDAATYLKKAVTIATRYSAVRRQCQIKPEDPETPIIDYVTQQHKLFPNIATAFAFQYAANWLWEIYNDVNSQLETGKMDNLPELHATSCVLKAVSTADAALGIETCRLACGGHGYMTASNLPSTYGLVTAMCTYEGENTVLLLQSARFLIKMWQNRNNLQHFPTLSYLCTPLTQKIPFNKSVDWIITILQKTSARKIELASNHINIRIDKGETSELAWNNTSIELVEAADIHGRAFIVQTFHESVKKLKVSYELNVVLNQLVQLYAVTQALKMAGHILRFSDMNGSELGALQNWLEDLLSVMRPNAVGLVDSFDFRDEVLASALGAADGNVYERLFLAAKQSPLNIEPVNNSFHLYLKPFLKSNM
ncbi:probable peroxisomal acyl-coenzyme A oxidase 1 [Anthonomus grandis grandis]|uniref:probable peroxisomal acyl-coenzyme A oxidase 1 n=1 Tax=Anthonomus grandis grandis TaxID=2921223 RepID=UPI002165259D|nr:probable peroxisomal acyl-coenzyme A oxidase 1 [Anthonomus grandis grandis]